MNTVDIGATVRLPDGTEGQVWSAAPSGRSPRHLERFPYPLGSGEFCTHVWVAVGTRAVRVAVAELAPVAGVQDEIEWEA